MNRLRWWLVSGAGIPWVLRIGARVSSTHPTGQRACRRPDNLIVAGHQLARWDFTTVSFASPAMADTPLSRSCTIRIISMHLLDAAGELLRVLLLARKAHISAEPQYVPRGEALILASNQQRVFGPQAKVQVL